jgi:hypothetical protein
MLLKKLHQVTGLLNLSLNLIFKNSEIELKDISANIYLSNRNHKKLTHQRLFFICISIKTFGLIIIDNELMPLRGFEHKYMDRIITTKHSKGMLNIGVLLDNQNQEGVKEFFIELSVVDDEAGLGEIFLNRVFITSDHVKAVQTDTQGFVAMFLIGTGVYIVPRSIYGSNNSPLYIYRDAYNSDSIKFIHIDTDGKNNIIFRLTNSDEKENRVISLYTTEEENESFDCRFSEGGNYEAVIKKQYLNHDRQPAIITTQFNVQITGPKDSKTENNKSLKKLMLFIKKKK